jgi:hypothetical protein
MSDEPLAKYKSLKKEIEIKLAPIKEVKEKRSKFKEIVASQTPERIDYIKTLFSECEGKGLTVSEQLSAAKKDLDSWTDD